MSKVDDDTMSALDTGGVSARVAGFGLTAVGGLLMGVGALMPWIRSSIAELPDEYSPTYYGIDLPDGLVVLAAAIVVLVGLAVTRLAASPDIRRLAAGVVIAASLVAIAIAIVAVLTAAGRFEPDIVEDVLADLPSIASGQRERVEELLETRLAPGAFVALAGGLLGVIGGLLLRSRAGSSDEWVGPADPAGGESPPSES